MIDDINRILVSDWTSKVSKYVELDPDADPNITPTFGYVIDYLRIKYNMYVCAVPYTDNDLEDEIVYGFRGETRYLKRSTLYRSNVNTSISYYIAIREAINVAISFLEQDEIPEV